MPRTRIKICGITRPEDAALVSVLGADAIGLNFFAGPRRITFEQAADIIADLPPLLMLVALVGGKPTHIYSGTGGVEDPTLGLGDPEVGAGVLRYIHFAQLHDSPSNGSSVLGVCHAQHVPLNNYWIVCRIASRVSLTAIQKDIAYHDIHPAAIVLDTAVKGQLGGTGQTFNWNWIAEARAAGELEGLPPIILAGGLTPDNVADAIRIARPYAVDVSSGVELPGKPGIKDPARLRAFIAAVRSTDTP